MARAALRSALYNVKINMGLIKDDEYVAAARAKMQQLEAKAMEIEAFVLARTVGSNPTLSATILPRLLRRVFCYRGAHGLFCLRR